MATRQVHGRDLCRTVGLNKGSDPENDFFFLIDKEMNRGKQRGKHFRRKTHCTQPPFPDPHTQYHTHAQRTSVHQAVAIEKRKQVSKFGYILFVRLLVLGTLRWVCFLFTALSHGDAESMPWVGGDCALHLCTCKVTAAHCWATCVPCARDYPVHALWVSKK